MSLSIALAYNTQWCCDRHDDAVFNLEDFLSSSSYSEEPIKLPDTRKRKKRPKYRPTLDRPALDDRIIVWLHFAVGLDSDDGSCNCLPRRLQYQ